MRILHVSTTIARGGAEHHLLELASRQRRAGHEVTVAWLKAAPELAPRFEGSGVALAPLGLSRYGDPRPAWRLASLLRRWQPDIVHAHMPPAELYGRAARALARDRAAYVVSKHNFEPFLPRWPAGGLVLGRWAGRAAHGMIAISDAVARRVRDEGFAPGRGVLEVVRYGLDPAPFRAVTPDEVGALREAWGVAPRERLVGTVARLEPQKALDSLLEAFARLLAEPGGERLRLAIVGRGRLGPVLQARAAALGIGDRCIWAGVRTDIPVVLRALDLFVLPSAWEGLGLVLLEAMAAGRPIVATDVDAIPEIVRHEREALLVPPRDPASLARAVRLALGPDVGPRLAVAGQERLAAFTPERMLERTEAVYAAARAVAGAERS